MTLEAAIAKTMWVLGNVEREKEAMEQAFYKKINYDLIFDALLQAH